MNIVLDNSFEESYICEIEESSGIIRWQYERDNRPDYILIVKTPFNSSEDIGEVLNIINAMGTNIVENEIISVTPKIYCKLANVLQGNRGIYKVDIMPAVYSVYGCKMHNDKLIVFEEKNKSHNHCKVSAIIEYRIEEHPMSINEGKFFKRSNTIYYFSKITVLQNKNYIDGVLYYTFDGCETKFPIGQHMLGAPFFVKWYNNSKPPIIHADYDGFKCQKL